MSACFRIAVRRLAAALAFAAAMSAAAAWAGEV